MSNNGNSMLGLILYSFFIPVTLVVGVVAWVIRRVRRQRRNTNEQ